MIISTLEQIAGYKMTKSLGVVSGNTIRARHLGKDIVAGLRTVVGGKIKEYAGMLAESREQALKRMIEKWEELNTDRIICVRFQTSMIMSITA